MTSICMDQGIRVHEDMLKEKYPRVLHDKAMVKYCGAMGRGAAPVLGANKPTEEEEEEAKESIDEDVEERVGQLMRDLAVG